MIRIGETFFRLPLSHVAASGKRVVGVARKHTKIFIVLGTVAAALIYNRQINCHVTQNFIKFSLITIKGRLQHISFGNFHLQSLGIIHK